jgi:shikimate dehydrogenase
MPAGETRLFAVVGDPVAHSLSPVMHNAAIAALGLPATYVAARTTAQAFPALVHELLEAGGGLNVTMPFKLDAARLVAHPSDAVRRTGACNTIWGDPDAPSGDNTDVAAIRDEALRLAAGGARRVRLAGTGGSARAAVAAVADAFPGAVIEIGSRSLERAHAFVAWALTLGATARVLDQRDLEPVQLLVLATPDPFAWPAREPDDRSEFAPPVEAMLDLQYARGGTPMVRMAREGLKIPAADGRGVLLAQGAASFERFFGVPAPVGVMRQAVEDALRA